MAKSYTEQLEEILGRRGGLVSGSKSCGPAMAVYNSNVVIGDRVVWYGDIDLEKSKSGLRKLAKSLSKDIEVYYESALRVWKFDTTSDEDYRASLAKQKEKIRTKEGMAWTTAKPRLFCGENYNKMRETRQEHRDEAIKARMIHYGALTPRGGEWTWYNRWFYKSIWKLMEKSVFQVWWSIKYSWFFKTGERGGWGPFFRSFVQELGYRFNIKWLQGIDIYKKPPQ